jgi:hypothetical protein
MWRRPQPAQCTDAGSTQYQLSVRPGRTFLSSRWTLAAGYPAARATTIHVLRHVVLGLGGRSAAQCATTTNKPRCSVLPAEKIPKGIIHADDRFTGGFDRLQDTGWVLCDEIRGIRTTNSTFRFAD